MSRALHIARREWLEQRRQPAMLAIITSTFVIIAGLLLFSLGMLQWASTRPEQAAQIAEVLGEGDPKAVLIGLSGTIVGIANWLLYTQFLGIAAVMAGHSILHDRQMNTLPFLLLAPVRRVELLAGKVVGAIAPAMGIYLVIAGATFAVMSTMPVTEPFADRLPPSPAWAVSFLIGGPCWALFVGTLCAIISSVSRDVRTAQQGVWFAVLFASFGCGFLLSVLLPNGVGTQLAVAAVGAFCAVTTLLTGSQITSAEVR